MPTKHGDILNTQLNTGETPNNGSHLITYHKIENTPFTQVIENGVGHYAVLGNYKITPAFDTMDEMIEYIEQNKWNIVMSIAIIINEVSKPIKQPDTTPDTMTKENKGL